MPDKKNYAMETLLTHAGNHPEANHGIVNPPVYHASTVLYPTIEGMERAQKDRLTGVFYGRYGTPTTFALEEAVAALEGGGRALALPSGLAAIGATLLSLLKAGDHLLMREDVAERTLRAVISWARYAELFSYNDDDEMFSLENPT